MADIAETIEFVSLQWHDYMFGDGSIDAVLVRFKSNLCKLSPMTNFCGLKVKYLRYIDLYFRIYFLESFLGSLQKE